MENNNFTQYVMTGFKDLTDDFNWKINFISNQHIYEITFALEIPSLALTYKLKGKNGQYSTHNQANVLQDKICFYDKNRSFVEKEDYLYSVVVDFGHGIEAGFVDAILKQLNIVANNGQNLLNEYVQYNTENSFALEWPEQAFAETIKTFKSSDRYNEDILTFDKGVE